MYITAVPHRNSPPAILLRESFRDGDKVRTRTRANLTSWAPERIDALRRALKGEFDYAALDSLANHQERREDAFYRWTVRQRGRAPTVVLYDVTSSYLEGDQNELAAFGYSRDKKPGKAPIVIGLLTTAEGEPLAVHVYEGNTSDPVTVPEQVQTLRTRFGLTELVFVGDRGMVKAKGQRALSAAGFRYITALTTPQVRRLFKAQVLRVEWFTSHVHEVVHGSVRLILRCSPALRQHEARRRADTVAKLQALITARNAFVDTAKRAKPATGLRTLQAWVKRHKLETFVQVSLHEGRLMATLAPAA